jgi:uncharacterized membrane protein YdbT with pleckstrin-like domain
MASANPPVEPTPDVSTAPQAETLVWEGSSSQILNLRRFLYCLLAIAVLGALMYLTYYLGGRSQGVRNIEKWVYIVLGVLMLAPVAMFLYYWIENKYRCYTVTTQRIKLSTGVLSKSEEELELYRVRDYTIHRPFLLRIFGAGNVVLTTSDKTTPIFVIEAIRNADEIQERIRTSVEYLRKTKRVREVDME